MSVKPSTEHSEEFEDLVSAGVRAVVDFVSNMYTFNAVDTFEAWRRSYLAKLSRAVPA